VSQKLFSLEGETLGPGVRGKMLFRPRVELNMLSLKGGYIMNPLQKFKDVPYSTWAAVGQKLEAAGGDGVIDRIKRDEVMIFIEGGRDDLFTHNR